VDVASLAVADEVDRADRGQFLVELGHAGARRTEIARGVVSGKERRRIHAVHAPRLLPQLLAPHPTLGRAQLDLVGGGAQAGQLTLGAPRVVLDRAKLGGQTVVLVSLLPGRRVATVTLDRALATRDVRTLSG